MEFGVAEGRRGEQALSVRLLAPVPSVAKSARRPPDELHGMIEDMIKLLDGVQNDLRRDRYPNKAHAQKVAKVVHAVAEQLEIRDPGSHRPRFRPFARGSLPPGAFSPL